MIFGHKIEKDCERGTSQDFSCVEFEYVEFW